MENLKIVQFISNNFGGYGYGTGSGSGTGYGSGSGTGYGYGYGYGCGRGYGDGYGCGRGDGNGCGNGYGDGNGCGNGCGSGFGDGYGTGYGTGYGSGIKKYNQSEIYLIDEIQTILTSVCGNLAKGYILKEDLTLSPCFIAKGNGYFAHGETAKEAREAHGDGAGQNSESDRQARFCQKRAQDRRVQEGKIMETKKFIVRSDRAGVFYGEIKERNGDEVTMVNVRRIWYWDGAASISQLAVDGTSKPQNCKFTIYVPEMIILGVIEIIPCTEKAMISIEGVKEWKI